MRCQRFLNVAVEQTIKSWMNILRLRVIMLRGELTDSESNTPNWLPQQYQDHPSN